MKKVWLVTGGSKGLGRAIVERALAGGDRVLATARDPAPLGELLSSYPSNLGLFSLDVTDEGQARAAVEAVAANFGRLDVLVNNAGYASIAPFEQLGAESFRDQVETNLFGVVNMVRAALPAMRKQRSGHIINISSVGGRVGAPGLSAYQAAKWAVGGFTEVLAKETAAFGVQMVSVEPGGMRTDWGATAKNGPIALFEDYKPSVGQFLDHMHAFIGNEVGDPARVASVVFDLSRTSDLPAHLLLGSDALQVVAASEEERRKAAEEWLDVSRSTDFGVGDIAYLSDGAFR